ncbi:MAG: ABC transporter permease [Desulfuromonadaceae bacterium]|nr:ABC transporter permease [Desulfuromonadaceae bacterium]
MFWLRFALRSVLRRHRRTRITFLSVGLAVALLIVLGAIMVGVNDTMIRNAVRLQTGHLAIDSPALAFKDAEALLERFREHLPVQDVEAFLPRYGVAGLLRQHQNRQAPLQLVLVDPALEQRWSPLPACLSQGHWLGEEEGLVIGQLLAHELDVKIGERLELVTAGPPLALTVVGVFHTGVDALDRSAGYASLSLARNHSFPALVHIRSALFVSSTAPLASLCQTLQMQAPKPLQVTRWQEKLPEVEQLVRLNEFSMQIMMGLVVLILGFGVANSLLISVMDRYRSYGILKAIGVRPREVMVTVVGEALILCLGAGLLGTALGVVISLGWGQVGLDISHYTSYNPHFSVDPMIYPRLEPLMVFLPQTLALVSAVVASVWPALVAARRGVSSSMREL